MLILLIKINIDSGIEVSYRINFCYIKILRTSLLTHFSVSADYTVSFMMTLLRQNTDDIRESRRMY
jgi:hypothetical protein